jgi:hypothetical protein
MKKKLQKVRKNIMSYKVALYGTEGATNNCDCNLRVGC